MYVDDIPTGIVYLQAVCIVSVISDHRGRLGGQPGSAGQEEEEFPHAIVIPW